MIVLGVDPGSRKTGYGVIAEAEGRLSVLGCGLIRPAASGTLHERIGQLCSGLEEVIANMKPEAVALETAFVGRNVRSALILGQVRGAVLATVIKLGLPVREYAPREIKLAVTGTGAARKEQVASMLPRLLGLEEAPKPLDVTDALGIAYCDLSRGASLTGHCGMTGSGKSRSKGWAAFVDAHPELLA
ncbi:crossover junction endodeoxyribonuclease RuvC [Chlorobaculum parvum NCIB 8327]|uniref:Crossover junction endodeoxyribonuclease RuvC n=1 Tax=Chlorobaculum parvum (strain DSM 263 / NCIMB 8327) TaxID=517417 RepID=RUVC_CHLP8|nr:crossover junction endodeoxyribonuclease RuvC [Chlorobaculum parvum]B3QLZ5.1 RecName: Full=Crossover junction endodeoxyribonuclease RuvC; AltName: Full=Holliday junction nuclease RuvC; AltName: Full=Holliday junction resolvase RuvC [Chlorobaculum parvum NCIB 8327]ACF10948.1 crossover junction endodeoxyribonuclease RuvC [Chlorobaculum parvum NCIB 8327]